MTHSLVELSDTRTVTTSYLVVEDYTKHPRLCRYGVWVGWKSEFTETVVLSYDHDPEELYVGWSINGTTVIDPGYSAGTPAWGAPAPGNPSVTYRCPVAGLYHRISLSSTPGDANQYLWVSVLYRHPNEANAPFHVGPSHSVCLSGSEIAWPAAKLAETQACLARLYDILRRYVEVAHVGPGDPVESWLGELDGDEVARVDALLTTIEQLNRETDRLLFEAIRAELTGMVQWARSPGRLGMPAPIEVSQSPGR